MTIDTIYAEGRALAELVWKWLVILGPYVLISILVVATLQLLHLDKKIAGVLGRRRAISFPGALLLGLVSPLCAVGMLPVVSSMVAAGTPWAPVMVFMIAEPLFGPSAFILTWGMLGWQFAVAKLLSAIVLGLAGGVFVEVFRIRLNTAHVSTRQRKPPAGGSCASPSCEMTARGPATTLKPFRAQTVRFARILTRTTFVTVKLMVLALIAQAVLLRYIPASWIEVTMGVNPTLAVPAAAVVGIPVYVNGASVLPILKGLMELGMDEGAALAFLIAGPVTTVPTIFAGLYLLGRRFLVWYVSVGFLRAVAFGYVFQWYWALQN